MFIERENVFVVKSRYLQVPTVVNLMPYSNLPFNKS